jgi:hypothetical protein
MQPMDKNSKNWLPIARFESYNVKAVLNGTVLTKMIILRSIHQRQ